VTSRGLPVIPLRSECSDNSKAIKELDQDNISICTHMESLSEDLKAFKLERNEMKSTSSLVINWKNILLESGSFGLSVP
jgi:hypothetical protein